MSAEAGRTLLVLRHAKGVTGGPGVDDKARELTGRGHRDAAAAGRWLKAAGLAPDHVLCSPASRTRQTWAEVRAALGGGGPEPDYSRRLYLVSEDELLQSVRESPEGARTVLSVGHNPASHQLVADLTGQAVPAFPTCALAVVKVQGSWADLAPGAAGLTRLWTPKAPG
jgi:phosphohistidine phosphatase